MKNILRVKYDMRVNVSSHVSIMGGGGGGGGGVCDLMVTPWWSR